MKKRLRAMLTPISVSLIRAKRSAFCSARSRAKAMAPTESRARMAATQAMYSGWAAWRRTAAMGSR